MKYGILFLIYSLAIWVIGIFFGMTVIEPDCPQVTCVQEAVKHVK